jgi:hypothetical protein
MRLPARLLAPVTQVVIGIFGVDRFGWPREQDL